MSNCCDVSAGNKTPATRERGNPIQTVAPGLAEVSATVNSLLPQLDEKEQRTSVELYRLLAKGEPVSAHRLASAVHLATKEIEDYLDRDLGVFRDDEKRIIGFWGLSLSKTRHRFEVDGRTLYTWCAWDTLFIPEILQKTARVESACPVTGETIRLTVAPNGIEQVEPVGAVMSVVLPERAKMEENVVRHFCHYVYFFASQKAASRWVSENKGTFFVSMDDAFALARKKNTAQFQDVLRRKETAI